MARSVVPIRLDPDEIARLDAAAIRHGLSRGGFIRMAALELADVKDASEKGRPRGHKRSRPLVDKDAVCRHGLASCRICDAARSV